MRQDYWAIRCEIEGLGFTQEAFDSFAEAFDALKAKQKEHMVLEGKILHIQEDVVWTLPEEERSEPSYGMNVEYDPNYDLDRRDEDYYMDSDGNPFDYFEDAEEADYPEHFE